ncbi:uncharacterized protein TNCV_2486091 [Trichonephila clavipes]|uniref:Uncharacterized protein n=1 Tax=Trichonephila clavipes TaxID=2585209 RepID=A0A8X7BCB5_TRICX|nr:uncharacterized protein TNCV_2486091 [Trichonephila clavipes]
MTGEHLSDCPALLHVLSQDNCGVLRPARATSALYWTARRLCPKGRWRAKITKSYVLFPPLHGPGNHHLDFEKEEAFKETLEVTFQEKAEPYCNDKIEEVENLINHFLDNFTAYAPLPSLLLLKYEALSKNCRIEKLLAQTKSLILLSNTSL